MKASPRATEILARVEVVKLSGTVLSPEEWYVFARPSLGRILPLFPFPLCEFRYSYQPYIIFQDYFYAVKMT